MYFPLYLHYYFLTCTTVTLAAVAFASNSDERTNNRATACGLSIGAKDDHPTLHRRMVSVELPQQCDSSNTINIDIPHEGMYNKTFTRTDGSFAQGDLMPGNLPATYTFWNGMDQSDGSIFSFIQQADGSMAASIVDLTNHNVYQINNAQGSFKTTITRSSDFPPEGEPHEVPTHLQDRNLFAVQDKESLQNNSMYQLKFLPHLPGSQSKQDEHEDDKINTTQPADDKKSSRNLLDDNGGNLDVLVVWTKRAECARSGLLDDNDDCTVTSSTESSMRALINLAVSETNTAYSASGINTQLHLAHAYRHSSYVEASSNAFSVTLNDATNGAISGVHDARTTYGADLVVVIIDDPQYCGLAWRPSGTPYASIMFSVTAWGCATGYYSFGHEIGHNLGCKHDRGTKNECSSSSYNFGYRDPQGSFRTTLAYNCRTDQCDSNQESYCSRIPRYSNPNYTYNDKALGDAFNDNARQINNVRVTVAGFYPHGGTSPTTAPPTPTPTAAPTPSPPTAAPTPTPPTAAPTPTPPTPTPPAPTPPTPTPPTPTPPTPSPTATPPTPVSSPVTTPSSPTSPTAPTQCIDSTVRFKLVWNGRTIGRYCDWVARKNTEERCAVDGVSAVCADTCGACNSCQDSTLRMKLSYNGREIWRYCVWVANKKTAQRCAIDGAASACRSTCRQC